MNDDHWEWLRQAAAQHMAETAQHYMRQQTGTQADETPGPGKNHRSMTEGDRQTPHRSRRGITAMEPRRSTRGSGQTSAEHKAENTRKQGVNAMVLDLLKRTIDNVSCGVGRVARPTRTLAILTSPFRSHPSP